MCRICFSITDLTGSFHIGQPDKCLCLATMTAIVLCCDDFDHVAIDKLMELNFDNGNKASYNAWCMFTRL